VPRPGSPGRPRNRVGGWASTLEETAGRCLPHRLQPHCSAKRPRAAAGWAAVQLTARAPPLEHGTRARWRESASTRWDANSARNPAVAFQHFAALLGAVVRPCPHPPRLAVCDAHEHPQRRAEQQEGNTPVRTPCHSCRATGSGTGREPVLCAPRHGARLDKPPLYCAAGDVARPIRHSRPPATRATALPPLPPRSTPRADHGLPHAALPRAGAASARGAPHPRPWAAPSERDEVWLFDPHLGSIDQQLHVPPPPSLRTHRTRRILHPVLIGHAASCALPLSPSSRCPSSCCVPCCGSNPRHEASAGTRMHPAIAPPPPPSTPSTPYGALTRTRPPGVARRQPRARGARQLARRAAAPALHVWARGRRAAVGRPAQARSPLLRRAPRTGTCPVCTGGGTRRVRLVRKEGRDVSS
jgi:hypothetical protein